VAEPVPTADTDADDESRADAAGDPADDAPPVSDEQAVR
jgi:hypothetical protein